jgi:hypothetical protein
VCESHSEDLAAGFPSELQMYESGHLKCNSTANPESCKSLSRRELRIVPIV